MDKLPFMVWVTKYALTSGIEVIEVTQSDFAPGMVSDTRPHRGNFHGEGKEWHRTQDGATLRAEEMRLNKIKSLKKSLDKFMNMTFD